jgi:uncharacterized membrane protein
MNKFGIWSVLVLILAISMAAAVTALPISFDRVEVDGTDLSPMGSTRLDLERGQTVDVRMEISSPADIQNVEITAFISGYEYNDFEKMSDTTHVFDMETGVTYVKNLKLTLPTKVAEDDYLLRILATDRNGEQTIQNYRLKLDVARHSLQITDVVFNPEDNVIAGRALLSTVRIKNAGEMDEESIKVTVAIPALAVSASDYIDTIQAGDSTTSEELYLRIPADAKPGIYDVLTTVKYDDGYEVITQKSTIQVSAPVCTEDACKGPAAKTDKTIITISTDTQKVTTGEGGTVYPIALTNQGSDTKTYVVKVDGTDGWATARISPSNVVVLAPGESSTVFIYLSATDKATVGEHMFSVTISSADNVLKELPLKASVVSSEIAPSFGWENIKTALEIGFVILVVILVVLGLIIGFSKLREKEEPEEVSGQTYY